MAHYAHINPFKEVDQVIVADASFIALLPDPENWLQTSYNTRGGKHYSPVTGEDDSTINPPFRKNYASIGFTYDKDRDAFIPPKPFYEWVLDETTCLWMPPFPYPNDGKVYIWVDELKNWIEVPNT